MNVIFKHTSFSNLLAGGIMAAFGLFSLWISYSDTAPSQKIAHIIVGIIFIGIGLIGAGSAAHTQIAVAPDGQISIRRKRLVTMHVFYEQHMQRTDLGYIHYAHSVTRGGGLWLVLKDGTRIPLATIGRAPLPIAVWPAGYVRTKGLKLSEAIGIPFVS